MTCMQEVMIILNDPLMYILGISNPSLQGKKVPVQGAIKNMFTLYYLKSNTPLLVDPFISI